MVPPWLCVIQRSSYFLSHHAVKWSLLAVSFERLFAVKFPYKYHIYFRRRNVIVSLTVMWLVTMAIDGVPFFSDESAGDRCPYSPHVVWSLTVIAVYNIVPFAIMVVNYALIWKIAATAAVHDRKISRNFPLPVIALEDEPRETKQLVGGTKLSQLKSKLDTNSVRKTLANMRSKVRRKYGRQESVSMTSEIIGTRESVKASKSRRLFLLEIKATKTSFMLVVVYVCCWGPLGVFYTIDQFCDKCLSRGGSQRYTRVAIKALCFSSSFIVPIVYCWFTAHFKKAATRLWNNITRQL